MENQTNQPQPGDAGTISKNGSTATRAAHIRVDRKRIRKYDRAMRQDVKNAWQQLTLGLAMAAAAVGLFWLQTWWGITLGVLAGLTAIAICWLKVMDLRYLYGKGRAEMYGDSLLIGAVVVREEPLTVLALTDVNTSDDLEYYRYFDGEKEISQKKYMDVLMEAWEIWNDEWEDIYQDAETAEQADEIRDSYWIPVEERLRKVKVDSAGRWACMLHVVGDGDWSYKLGDRMPCSSGYGEEDEKLGVWTSMQVIPLVWGTRNEEDLKRCLEAIPDFEWKLLEKLAPKAEELKEEVMYLVRRLPDGGIELETVAEAMPEVEMTESWDLKREKETRGGELSVEVDWNEDKEARARRKEKSATEVELNGEEF